MVVRVTNNSMIRNYQRNYGSAMASLQKIQNQILQERKFSKASENPVKAQKALSVRNALNKNQTHQDNLKTAYDLFITAEDLITKNMCSKYHTITDKMVYGLNGEKSDTERNIIAKEIEENAASIMQDLNNEYSGRRLFGGNNNSTVAFTYDKDTNTVMYNGEDVNKYDDPNDFPGSTPILIDVGIGIVYDDTLPGGADPDTAMDLCINGAEVTGCGKGKDGNSNNIVQLAYDAAKALRENDMPKARELLGALRDRETNLSIAQANFGVKQQNATYNLERAKDNEVTLKAAQEAAELMSPMDLAEAATEWKAIDFAYNSVLQMGAKVIPVSIFDYLR